MKHILVRISLWFWAIAVLIYTVCTSCTSIRTIEIELYKKAVYKNCITDMECEQADQLIYARFYACDYYHE